MSNSSIPRPAQRLGACALVLVLTCFLTGCGGSYLAPVMPPTGAFFTDVKAPLTVDHNSTLVNQASERISSGKTFFFFPLLFDVAWDDASIARIAREGGIEEVAYADYEYLNILGIYAEFTVNVYGK